MPYPEPNVRAASTVFFVLSLAFALTAAALTALICMNVLPAVGFVAAGVAAVAATVAAITQRSLPWLGRSPLQRHSMNSGQ